MPNSERAANKQRLKIQAKPDDCLNLGSGEERMDTKDINNLEILEFGN